jgi:glyceraldehyde 3-phosphate dehydrogenase
MADVRVAINGFGRIGRLAFRQMITAEGFEVVAINDLTSPEMLAYLLKYDTTHGRYPGKVEAKEHSIVVDGKEITIYAEKDAADLPWGELNIDVVLECTGFYTSKEKSMAHIKAGAKHVVISAPAGNDLKTIVYNVNHESITADDQIISAASCTTNCLAPMAKALNDLAPIEAGFMTTVHAYTGDQMVLDGPQRKGNFRRSRAAAMNITPASSGAAKAIGLVLPELDGKLNGAAQRVPTATGSTTILDAIVEKEVTVDEVNAQMKAEETESFEYNTDEIVSADIINSTAGSIFDATQTKVLPMPGGKTLVQVVSWYDNENSYTSQMVRTIKHFGSLISK